MRQPDKENKNVASILVALDQISQTIDVMTRVVGTLRVQVLEQRNKSNGLCREKTTPLLEETDYTLH